jgi:hypothetical protein
LPMFILIYTLLNWLLAQGSTNASAKSSAPYLLAPDIREGSISLLFGRSGGAALYFGGFGGREQSIYSYRPSVSLCQASVSREQTFLTGAVRVRRDPSTHSASLLREFQAGCNQTPLGSQPVGHFLSPKLVRRPCNASEHSKRLARLGVAEGHVDPTLFRTIRSFLGHRAKVSPPVSWNNTFRSEPTTAVRLHAPDSALGERELTGLFRQAGNKGSRRPTKHRDCLPSGLPPFPRRPRAPRRAPAWRRRCSEEDRLGCTPTAQPGHCTYRTHQGAARAGHPSRQAGRTLVTGYRGRRAIVRTVVPPRRTRSST